MSRRALARVVLLLSAALPMSACRPACEGIGLCDPQPLQPVDIHLLCDAGGGSPCAASFLEQVQRRVIPELANRPGSVVSLWTLGVDLANTREAVRHTIVTRGFPGSTSAHRYFQIQTDSIVLHSLAALRFTNAEPTRRSSPIAEGISKIAHSARENARPWILLIISDGLQQTSDFQFECNPRPSPEQFIAALARRRLLEPGSLDGALNAMLLHGELKQIPDDRCEQTMERGLELEAIWKAALEQAGAAATHIGANIPGGAILLQNEG